MSYSVLTCIPLVHSSKFDFQSAPSRGVGYGIDDPVSESAHEVVAFGGALEEWGVSFFHRLFALAQARGQRAKKGMSAQLDNIIDFFLAETMTMAFSQLADQRPRVLKEICGFLLEDAVLPDAHREAQSLVMATLTAEPEMVVNALVPGLCAKIEVGADSKVAAWALVVSLVTIPWMVLAFLVC